MIESCEKKAGYGLINAEGQRESYVFRYEKRPLLHTSRLPACLARKVELGLAMGTAATYYLLSRLNIS